MNDVRQLIKENIKEYSNKKELTIDFINFVVDELGIKTKFKVKLTTNKDKNGIRTTAVYKNNDCEILIYIKNRACVDVLRSICHEMVHHLQNQRGELMNNPNAGDDGSPQENEANAIAGIMIRKYGRKNPIIYTL
jgi:Zn-dependent peptidase ImmA (M78 family)